MLRKFFENGQDEGGPEKSGRDLKRGEGPERDIDDEQDEEDNSAGSKIGGLGDERTHRIDERFLREKGVENRKGANDQHEKESHRCEGDEDLDDAGENVLIAKDRAQVARIQAWRPVLIGVLVEEEGNDGEDPDEEGVADDFRRHGFAVLETEEKVPKEYTGKRVDGEFEELSEGDIEDRHGGGYGG